MLATAPTTPQADRTQHPATPTTIDRLPPNNTDAEEAALGSCLMDPEAIGRIRDTLGQQDFFRERNGTIFRAMLDVSDKRKQPVDFLTVSEELKRSGSYEEVGGLGYLSELIGVVPTATHVEHYASLVRESALRRQVISQAARIASQAYDETFHLNAVLFNALQELERLHTKVESASDGSAAQPLPGRANIVLLANVKAERVSWLWPGRVPLGKLTVIDGDPGLGKTTITDDIAARVTTNRPMPGETLCTLPEPAGVVLLSAEDGLADTVRPRLEAAGADVNRVVALAGVLDADGERLPTLADLAEIEEAVLSIDARLVVIDPLMAYLDGATNAHRDQDIRRLLAPLAALAEKTGAAIVVVRHLNKMAGGDPLYRGGGSIGIIGAARSGLLVAKDPDDPLGARRILASSKCNLAATPPALAYHMEPGANGAVRVIWEGETEHTAASLLAMPSGGEERSALDEAKDFLRDMLADGKQPSKDVQAAAHAAGIAEATLRRARTVLKVKVIREGFGRDGRFMWELPQPIDAHAVPIDSIDDHSQKMSTNGQDEHQCSNHRPTNSEEVTEWTA